MCVPGLEDAEGRNYVAEGVKSVSDPGLFKRSVPNVVPDTDSSGEGLGLVAGSGIDHEIGCNQIPECGDYQAGAHHDRDQLAAGYGRIANEQQSLPRDKRGDGCLAERAQESDGENNGSNIPRPMRTAEILGHEDPESADQCDCIGAEILVIAGAQILHGWR